MNFTKIKYLTASILASDSVGQFTNALNQTFELAIMKGSGKIIVFYHKEELAYLTDFEEPDYFLAANPLVKAYFFEDYLYFPRLLPEKFTK